MSRQYKYTFIMQIILHIFYETYILKYIYICILTIIKFKYHKAHLHNLFDIYNVNSKTIQSKKIKEKVNKQLFSIIKQISIFNTYNIIHTLWCVNMFIFLTFANFD